MVAMNNPGVAKQQPSPADEIRRIAARRQRREQTITTLRRVESDMMRADVADLRRLAELQQQILVRNDAVPSHDAGYERLLTSLEGDGAFVPADSLDQELQTPSESRKLFNAINGHTIDLGDTQLTHEELLELQKSEDLPPYADCE